MRYLITLWVLLSFSSHSSFATNDACHFQEISSIRSADFVWFQILDNLERTTKSGVISADQFKTSLHKAVHQTLESCGQDDSIFYDLASLKNIQIIDSKVSFEMFQKPHELEWLQENGKTAFIYRRPNQKGYQTVYFQLNRLASGQLLNIRALGREAGLESTVVRYFFYDGSR